jgi:hypothetical protein
VCDPRQASIARSSHFDTGAAQSLQLAVLILVTASATTQLTGAALPEICRWVHEIAPALAGLCACALRSRWRRARNNGDGRIDGRGGCKRRRAHAWARNDRARRRSDRPHGWSDLNRTRVLRRRISPVQCYYEKRNNKHPHHWTPFHSTQVRRQGTSATLLVPVSS